MKKTLLFLPLVLLIAVVLFLVVQLRNASSPQEDGYRQPFPAFQLPSLLDSNAVLSNNSLPQKPFLLNVWASWCSWCIKEFPMLLRLQDKGVKIVGLTLSDRPEDARQALEHWGNPFEFVIDDYQQRVLADKLQIYSAPITYLIDKKGVIRYQYKGYNPDLEQDVLLKLEALSRE